MNFNEDRYNIFDDDNFYQAHDLSSVLDHLNEGIENDHIQPGDALEAVLNIIKPGATENSHDIRHMLMVAMISQNFEAEAWRIEGAYLTQFPWGFSIHLSIRDKENEFTAEAQKAVTRSIYSCIVAGGIKASFSDKGIHIDNQGGSIYSVDQQVEKFREQLDKELGPDTESYRDTDTDSKVTEWMKRWMGQG